MSGAIVARSANVMRGPPARCDHDVGRGARARARGDRAGDDHAPRARRAADDDEIGATGIAAPGRAGARTRRPALDEVEQQARAGRRRRTMSVAERDERQDLDRRHVGEVVRRGPRGTPTPRRRRPAGTSTADSRPPRIMHERRDRGGRRADQERADERQELADEAGQAGQAGRGEDEEAEDRGLDRHARGEAAHLRDRPVVGPLVDHADEEEQGAGDQAVVDHLEDRALDALLGEHEEPERDEAHVADRRVRDERLRSGWTSATIAP